MSSFYVDTPRRTRKSIRIQDLNSPTQALHRRPTTPTIHTPHYGEPPRVWDNGYLYTPSPPFTQPHPRAPTPTDDSDAPLPPWSENPTPTLWDLTRSLIPRSWTPSSSPPLLTTLDILTQTVKTGLGISAALLALVAATDAVPALDTPLHPVFLFSLACFVLVCAAKALDLAARRYYRHVKTAFYLGALVYLALYCVPGAVFLWQLARGIRGKEGWAEEVLAGVRREAGWRGAGVVPPAVVV